MQTEVKHCSDFVMMFKALVSDCYATFKKVTLLCNFSKTLNANYDNN